MLVRMDDPGRPEVAALLEKHILEMRATSPPESTHVLDLASLRAPSITFWSAWQGRALAGIGALKELNPRHGEIKSMRTARRYLRTGVAKSLLVEIIEEAERRAYERLSLETGSMAEFAPARALYARFGFRSCGPFGDYAHDPNSVFMMRYITSAVPAATDTPQKTGA